MIIELTENSIGKRLDSFLQEALGIPRAHAQSLIAQKKIFVNGENKKSSYKIAHRDSVQSVDNIELTPKKQTLKAQNIPLDIVFEDEHMLVVNKPKGMLTHPTSYDSSDTLVNALMGYLGDNLSTIGGDMRRGIVHRLDKNTSGLLMVAKTDEAHNNLQEQIKSKTAIRKYLAVALGNFKEDGGIITKRIAKNLGNTVKMYVPKNSEEGLEAKTTFHILEKFDGAAFIELELATGRTHQIRLHMSSINHPIFGDSLYGAKSFQKFSKIKTTEQVLMSYYLKFKHPITGVDMEFKLEEDKWDKDLVKVLKILRGNET